MSFESLKMGNHCSQDVISTTIQIFSWYFLKQLYSMHANAIGKLTVNTSHTCDMTYVLVLIKK